MTDVTIRVSVVAYDRLAALAEARGTSIRSLVDEFAESTLTAAEREERAERVRRYLAEHFGIEVTDEESAEMGRKMREAFGSCGRTPA